MKLPFPFFLIRVFKTKELNKGRYRQKIAKQCMKKTRLSRERNYIKEPERNLQLKIQ